MVVVVFTAESLLVQLLVLVVVEIAQILHARVTVTRGPNLLIDEKVASKLI
jgi:hypothetical protein